MQYLASQQQQQQQQHEEQEVMQEAKLHSTYTASDKAGPTAVSTGLPSFSSPSKGQRARCAAVSIASSTSGTESRSPKQKEGIHHSLLSLRGPAPPSLVQLSKQLRLSSDQLRVLDQSPAKQAQHQQPQRSEQQQYQAHQHAQEAMPLLAVQLQKFEDQRCQRAERGSQWSGPWTLGSSIAEQQQHQGNNHAPEALTPVPGSSSSPRLKQAHHLSSNCSSSNYCAAPSSPVHGRVACLHPSLLPQVQLPSNSSNCSDMGQQLFTAAAAAAAAAAGKYSAGSAPQGCDGELVVGNWGKYRLQGDSEHTGSGCPRRVQQARTTKPGAKREHQRTLVGDWLSETAAPEQRRGQGDLCQKIRTSSTLSGSVSRGGSEGQQNRWHGQWQQTEQQQGERGNLRFLEGACTTSNWGAVLAGADRSTSDGLGLDKSSMGAHQHRALHSAGAPSKLFGGTRTAGMSSGRGETATAATEGAHGAREAVAGAAASAAARTWQEAGASMGANGSWAPRAKRRRGSVGLVEVGIPRGFSSSAVSHCRDGAAGGPACIEDSSLESFTNSFCGNDSAATDSRSTPVGQKQQHQQQKSGTARPGPKVPGNSPGAAAGTCGSIISNGGGGAVHGRVVSNPLQCGYPERLLRKARELQLSSSSDEEGVGRAGASRENREHMDSRLAAGGKLGWSVCAAAGADVVEGVARQRQGAGHYQRFTVM